MTTLDVTPIGVIHTRHTDLGATPVQTALNPHDHGRVVLHPAFVDGLVELDGFDYLWLLNISTPNSHAYVRSSIEAGRHGDPGRCSLERPARRAASIHRTW